MGYVAKFKVSHVSGFESTENVHTHCFSENLLSLLILQNALISLFNHFFRVLLCDNVFNVL